MIGYLLVVVCVYAVVVVHVTDEVALDIRERLVEVGLIDTEAETDTQENETETEVEGGERDPRIGHVVYLKHLVDDNN